MPLEVTSSATISRPDRGPSMSDPLAAERATIHEVYADTIRLINSKKLSPMAFYTLAGVIASQAVTEAADSAELAHALMDELAKGTHGIINQKFGN